MILQGKSTTKLPKKLLFLFSMALIVSNLLYCDSILIMFLVLQFSVLQFSVLFWSLGLFCVASVFAYGQTSSGKTFTMSGVTQYAVADIYDYIEQVMED